MLKLVFSANSSIFVICRIAGRIFCYPLYSWQLGQKTGSHHILGFLLLWNFVYGSCRLHQHARTRAVCFWFWVQSSYHTLLLFYQLAGTWLQKTILWSFDSIVFSIRLMHNSVHVSTQLQLESCILYFISFNFPKWSGS